MAKRLSNIVDPSGRPFEVAVLNSKQTDETKVAGLHRRFSEHPTSGLTPYRLVQIMHSAEQGLLVEQAEMAEDMEEKDGHIFSETQKRKLAMQSIEWQIEPPRNATAAEKKAAEFIWERLAYLDLADIIFDMADAILKSYSCLTIEWGLIDGYQTPINIEQVPASWFTTPQEKRNELQLINDQGGSDSLWAGGWIVHQHKTKSGFVGRNGLVRVLAWPFLFKNYSVRDLAEFLEIYGLPLRLGKYPSGATAEEKSKLLQAVVEIGHNAAGIIPDSMLIDFQNAAQGQSDPFEAMIAWAEKTVSKAVLGGTLTSQADGKSSTNALGNVHNEVRHDIRDADLRQIANTLTRDLIWPMVQFNLTGIDGFHRCPKFKFDTTEAEDIDSLATAVPKLQSSGMRVSRKWLHDKTQIPEAKDDNDLLKPMSGIKTNQQTALTQQVSHIQGCQCAGCQTAMLTHQSGLIKTSADNIAEQLAIEANSNQTALIDKIRQLVDKAQNFEQLQNDLLQLAGHDVKPQAELIAQAIMFAELQGRSDILDEAINGV